MSEKGPILGHQRVAAFLLSLEPEAATNVLRHMKEDIVAKVARAMVDLDPRLSEVGTVDQLYRELALRINGPKRLAPCDAGALGRILSDSFGRPRGEEVLRAILERRQSDRPFMNVERYAPELVMRALEGEGPALKALVLGYLDPGLSAKILQLGDEEAATDLVRRMAILKSPPADVLLSIAAKIEERLAALVEEPDVPDAKARLRSIAELINNSPPTFEKPAIEAISSEDDEMAAELREFMFTWDDIGEIDKRSMQKILGSVDTKTLSIALKACTPEVEANVMSNLSERVREMVKEEREMAGPMPLSDVEAARMEIMTSIRAMIEAGDFAPSRGGADLVS